MDTAYAYSVNPGTLREKYHEAIELILKAWTATEPFAFNGRFTQMRYVNVLPRPLQQPHPPIWIPGGGSVETWDYCSQNDFVYAALSYYGHLMAKETVSGYWRRVEANGKDPNPYRLAFLQFIGVADTDEEAYRLYREPAEYFFNRSLHVYPGYADPPGYVTEASARARYKSQVRAVVRAKQAKHDLTWDEMVEKGYVVIGSPDTVRETLADVATDVQLRPPADDAAVRQHERRADPLQQRAVRRQGGARPARPVQRRRGPLVAGGAMAAAIVIRPTSTSSYLPSGSPATRRARRRWRCSRDAGWDVVVPELPGFDGRSGFRPPDDHLGWLTVVWDALDATGALPCPVVGASVGGMLAADLAVFRPEAVTALALLAPFGIFDDAQPGPRRVTPCRQPSGWPTSSPRASPSRSSTASPTSGRTKGPSPGTSPTSPRRA